MKNLIAVRVSSFIAIGLISCSALANIQTNCLDIRVNKNVNYSTCNIRTPSQAQLAAAEEREAVNIYRMIKKQVERTVAQNWRPPMGFSGYNIKVSYIISPMGTLEHIKFEDHYVSHEMQVSLLSALQSVQGVYIPNNKALEKHLATTRITSIFYIR